MKRLLTILFITAATAAAQPANLLHHAIHGDANAQTELALQYVRQKDFAKAVGWLEKAAAQNHAQAQTALASRYERGEGVAQNYQKARELYEKAASQGDAIAMHNLGVFAEQGWGGDKNTAQALD